MADNTSVEWALHVGEGMTTVGTLHSRDNVGSYADFGFSSSEKSNADTEENSN